MPSCSLLGHTIKQSAKKYFSVFTQAILEKHSLSLINQCSYLCLVHHISAYIGLRRVMTIHFDGAGSIPYFLPD